MQAADPPAETARGRAMLDAYFARETAKIADACLADVKTKADWEKQRPERRRQFLEMMGLWPLPPRTDLKPVVTGKLDGGTFTVEKLHFQSMPGLYVTANLYVPKNLKGPVPAILYVCGHANTVIDKVSYGSKVNYQHHPAWFAEHGYVAMILDTLELGEIQGFHHGTHPSGKLNMWWWQTVGYTPAGVECWNAMRALDYLETRPEVDPKRFGVTGRSGGGATSWWLAAADERPQCIIPVAGIADLQAHVVNGENARYPKGVIEGHCDCMYMVNTYRWDFPMVAALCAPRPLLLGNSDADLIFPVPGYRRLADKVRRIYDLYGAGDKFALLETKGPHKDTPELRLGAYRWMNRWLKNDTSEVTEKERKPFTPQELRVFDRLPADAINTRIHETFVEPAREPALRYRAKQAELDARWRDMTLSWRVGLKQKVFRGWPIEVRDLDIRISADLKRDGIRLRAFDFASQERFVLRLWLLTSVKTENPKNIIVKLLGEADWQDWLATLGPALAATRQAAGAIRDVDRFECTRKDLESTQAACALIAPRGIGLTRWCEPGTPDDANIRRRFVLLGQTLDEMRVWDVQRALATLRNQPELERIPLELHASGEMAGIALYATSIELDETRLVLRRLPGSHRNGPIFLNVRRVFDMPQALAMAFPKRITLHVKDEAEAKAWRWPLELQQLLGQDFVKIERIEK